MTPLHKLPNETVLWQARPGWRGIAHGVFHIRVVAVYFALVFIWGAANDRWQGLTPLETLRAEAPVAGLAAGVCGILAVLAWLVMRSTAYAVTDRRVVLRFGMALPATLSLPLRTIANVAVRVHRDHSGEIALALRPGESVGFVTLWPLVRPWRMRRPQPLLLAVPRAGMVAAVLSRTLAAAQSGALAELRGEAVQPPMLVAAE